MCALLVVPCLTTGEAPSVTAALMHVHLLEMSREKASDVDKLLTATLRSAAPRIRNCWFILAKRCWKRRGSRVLREGS